jgi:hypothetical protein
LLESAVVKVTTHQHWGSVELVFQAHIFLHALHKSILRVGRYYRLVFIKDVLDEFRVLLESRSMENVAAIVIRLRELLQRPFVGGGWFIGYLEIVADGLRYPLPERIGCWFLGLKPHDAFVCVAVIEVGLVRSFLFGNRARVMAEYF